MEEKYLEAKSYFEEKNYIEALKIFSKIEYLDSKNYENKCIDNLEDLIYYSKRRVSLEYLDKLKFYKDYSYFIDAYKRKRTDFISKIIMIICLVISTSILVFSRFI